MTDTDKRNAVEVIDALCDKLEEFGRGNLYAQVGMCREFILKEESKTRSYWEGRK